ncbi:hypothetical protein SAMN02910358_01440 [Lachnospiraceae bacterium XBB1006]|nr:hypothetical protein SAMN02910358_01440 [Lachnospiraceae bacterium XBB1006]
MELKYILATAIAIIIPIKTTKQNARRSVSWKNLRIIPVCVKK